AIRMKSARSSSADSSVSDMSSFQRSTMASTPALLDEAPDLVDHRLDVVEHLVVGEAQDRVAVELELDVAASVGAELERAAVVVAVDLDHAALGAPDEVDADRRGEGIGLVGLVPGPAGRPGALGERGLEQLFRPAGRVRFPGHGREGDGGFVVDGRPGGGPAGVVRSAVREEHGY